MSDVQRDFQECSHNKSLKLYEDIQRLQEGRFSRNTNDLDSELIREDREATLDPILDIRPKLCSALLAISKDCIETFNKCFSREDRQQIKRQHIEQMQKYYARIYEGVGNLTDCPHMKEDPEDPEDPEDQIVDEYNEVDPTAYADDNYDDDYYYPEAANRQATTTTSRPSLKTAEETRAVLEPSSSTLPDEDPEGNAVIAEAASTAAAGNGLEKRLLPLLVFLAFSTLLWRP